MVARAQAAHLAEPSLGGAGADVRRIRVGHGTGVLTSVEIAGHAVAAFDGVPRPARQQQVQLRPVVKAPQAAAADTARDEVVQSVHDRGQ